MIGTNGKNIKRIQGDTGARITSKKVIYLNTQKFAKGGVIELITNL